MKLSKKNLGWLDISCRIRLKNYGYSILKTVAGKVDDPPSLN